MRLLRLLPLAGLLLALAPPRQAKRPNVLIVLTDDQGYGDLSCLGNPVLKTPNLDRLHAESVRFTDFHVAPMCTPTRGQLMTGRDALANGAMNVSSGRTLLRRGIPTMPEVFAASGYRCGLFGKWHLGDNHPYRPQDRGFHESVWYPSSHISSAPDFWNNSYFDDTYRHNGRFEKYSGYCTDVFFGEAMRWMKECAAAGRPTFTYLALNAPHGPLFVAQKYRDLYKDQPRNVASFFGMIANIDENMAKLDAFLRENKLRDDTIVVFMTDNGGTAGVPVFNAGMRGKKIDLYEGGHRVPCFVRWPAGGLRAAGDVSELAEVQDLLPTFIDLCGLERPKDAAFDGVSLAKLLMGKEERLADRKLVIQFSRMNAPRPKKGDAAILWQKWRLVADKELYDIAADPGQKENVIGKHGDVAAAMRAHYDAWWSRVEPRIDEFGRILVGSDAENPCVLSPCEWQDVFLDQSAQIRRGEARNGAWNLEVDRDGEYEISLRRWPAEADAPIAAGLPAVKIADGTFPAGLALPIAKARLAIAGLDETRPVTREDKAAVFSTTLKAGPARLQAWFLDDAGKELCGAYSVTVRRK
jgi:arylsulfatase A-like enzyme